jgi:Abi-like protein
MTPEIQKFLSIHRLTPYRLPGETSDTAFSRYQWNIKLAEALLPSINYLEIGLRNGLDSAISSIYGQNWILSPPYQLRMSEEDKEQIQNLQHSIQRVKGYPAKHDDVLAALGFGFWIAFFHKRYVPGLWSRGKNPVAVIFPYMPVALRTREQIFTRLRTIKTLRNRIAHHEPIWKMTPTADETHRTCLEIVRGMSVTAAEELAKIDRFSSVYANGLKEK